MDYYGKYSNNDYRYYLEHHGIDGQKWGVKHGPPYPLTSGQSRAIKKASHRIEKNNAKIQKAYDQHAKKSSGRSSDVKRSKLYGQMNKYAYNVDVAKLKGQVGMPLTRKERNAVNKTLKIRKKLYGANREDMKYNTKLKKLNANNQKQEAAINKILRTKSKTELSSIPTKDIAKGKEIANLLIRNDNSNMLTI